MDLEAYRDVFRALPTPYLVMSPALEVLSANDALLVTVGRSLVELRGQPVFEAFPPSADVLDDRGRSPAHAALEQCRDSREPILLPIQRYAIRDLDGVVRDHHWSLIASPVLDRDGVVRMLLLRAEDVSDWVEERDLGRLQGAEWRRRVEEVETDLFTRAQELSVARAATEESARRVASLADVALELTSVDTLEQLEEVVVGRGLGVLGADGGAVVSLHEDGSWRLSVNAALGERVQVHYGHLPYDSPLPAVWTARTGERLVLTDRAAGLAFSETMRQVYADTGRESWAFLPLKVRGASVGALAVSWARPRQLDEQDLEVLEGFAAQCAQALDRIRVAREQREAAMQVERISEALQVSLLTSPSTPPGLDIAARYLPAMQQAQVGGDWYDAFVDTSGATLLSVGDVAGHDRSAAAAMAQVRSLVRGLAVDSGDGPAVVLRRLDRALGALELDVLATALLARVEGDVLRWSSAGHLPPVVCLPDGTVRVLDAEPDLLLGLDPTTSRSEQQTTLARGTTLVLCTDGLVERRDESLDAGVTRLVEAVAGACGREADELCDAVLAAMLPQEPEDDVALLVVRVL